MESHSARSRRLKTVGPWLQDNWFKAGILLVLFILVLSLGYYYVIFLPRNQNRQLEQKAAIEQKEKSEEKSQKIMLQACLDDADSNYNNYWTLECENFGTNNKGPDCSLPSYNADRANSILDKDKANCFKQYGK